MAKWLLYGANGYTGQLILAEAVARHLAPVISGRNNSAIKKIASKYNIEHCCFDLSDPDTVAQALKPFDLVLNAAGPFVFTAEKLMNACLASGTSYLDVTGEIDVFESCFKKTKEFYDAGLTCIPGVGFDVVPSDCLALALKQALPNAKTLDLAFKSDGKMSRGTLKTVIEHYHKGCVIRRDGEVIHVKHGELVELIPFVSNEVSCMAIPWGDIITAYHSTGIQNITVYFGLGSSGLQSWQYLSPLFSTALRVPGMKSVLAKVIEKMTIGPDREQRRVGRCEVWGRVTNSAGVELSGSMQTEDGYQFTGKAATAAVSRILSGTVGRGVLTPSLAFGSGFADETGGVIQPIEIY